MKDLKHSLQEKKNSHISNYLQNLKASEASGYSLWKATKRLAQPKNFSAPIRAPSGEWARSDRDKGSLFAAHLAAVFQPNPRVISERDESELLNKTVLPITDTSPIGPVEVRETAEHLLERLIEEESLLVSDEEETVALAAATFSKKKRQGKQQGSNHKKDVECYHCHDKGHYARNCPQRQHKSKSRAPNISPKVAFVAEKTLEDKRNPKVSPLDCRKWNFEQEKKFLEAPAADVCVADSGASAHTTHNRNWLTNYRPSKKVNTIILGDEGECAVVGEGTVVINRFLNGEWHEALIENVLYVPKLKKNLFSIGQITSKGYEVNFTDAYVKLKKNDTVVAVGIMQTNCIYRLLFKTVIQEQAEVNACETNLKIWHERLAHLNLRAIKELANQNMIDGLQLSDKNNFFCEPCQLGKQHRLPFKRTVDRMTSPGEYFHSDVCGPLPEESLGGARARLCARGFMQREGDQDYTETYAPVVRYDSTRVLLAHIAHKDLEATTFDVKSAFLYGDLKENIFMEIPKGKVFVLWPPGLLALPDQTRGYSPRVQRPEGCLTVRANAYAFALHYEFGHSVRISQNGHNICLEYRGQPTEGNKRAPTVNPPVVPCSRQPSVECNRSIGPLEFEVFQQRQHLKLHHASLVYTLSVYTI
ncbi:unnamed protein product, partial [Trichogramma brassicae]